MKVTMIHAPGDELEVVKEASVYAPRGYVYFVPSPPSATIQGMQSILDQGFKQLAEELENELFGSIASQLKPLTCDCGGFKTFNTMSPESHSSWCSSRQTFQQKT